MPVFELDSRLTLGPLHLGKKVVRELLAGQEVILLRDEDSFSEESSELVARYLGYGEVAIILTDDVLSYESDAVYLRDNEINRHPLTRSRLEWRYGSDEMAGRALRDRKVMMQRLVEASFRDIKTLD